MKKEWLDAIITKISVAFYVSPNMGKAIHKDRPYHGFVLNDEHSVKEYYFSDGLVMRTESCELFYLPKGSSYYVKVISNGGCYAINFDADIDDEPFSVRLKNYEQVKKMFKSASNEWRTAYPVRQPAAMRALYDSIYMLCKSQMQEYIPSSKGSIIAPAVELINERFTDSSLTVASLAEACGVSEVYLRRIFSAIFGMSPVEYIIQKRMDYAKRLLSFGELGISRVAEICGYKEPCHFSREFRRRFGVPPGKYH